MISELNGSKSAQAFLLFAGSELRKLLQTEDRQAELEFSLTTSQQKVTAASKSGATNLLSLLSESVKKVAARVSSEALYQINKLEVWQKELEGHSDKAFSHHLLQRLEQGFR